MTSGIGAVVIGRNEGERLKRCFESLGSEVSPVIYVDSGSTDGSVELARDMGVEVMELDLTKPFTAARARNLGLEGLKSADPDGGLVQFIDGDCELREGWIAAGSAALASSDDIAVVCGRRRERLPEASIWNRLVDAEWDTPIGEANACGGDALMRRDALDEVGGYRDDLICGEEPEMCWRLRQKGWRVTRIDAEMTWHDADITRVGQWWQRSRRTGHGYAETSSLYGGFDGPENYRARQIVRVLAWGFVLPLVAVLGAFFSPWFLTLFALWPLQILRLTVRGMSLERATWLMLGRVPEAFGVVGYWLARLTGRRQRLIEYKS